MHTAHTTREQSDTYLIDRKSHDSMHLVGNGKAAPSSAFGYTQNIYVKNKTTQKIEGG
jgi:hypothetical protein